MCKPLNDVPNWIQCMFLQLQRYSLSVNYKRGSKLHLADTLSRAYILQENASVDLTELAEIDHTLSLTLAPEDIQPVRKQDVAIQELCIVIPHEWPGSKARLPDAACLYYDF